jgi:hypothetical protein
VCFGKAAKTLLLLLRLLDFRVACRYWVISYSVPFRFSFLLLFWSESEGPASSGKERARLVAILTIVDQGWGAVYGYIGHLFGSLLGTSDWVRGTLQTRTIRG